MTRWTWGVLVWIGLVTTAQATTWNAASCSQADVASAIASASVGDTVQVPAGTCSWTGQSVSGISLIGAGSSGSGTNISAGLVTVTKHGTQNTRVSAFRFTGTDQHFAIGGSSSNKPYIIDHNYLNASSNSIVVISANGGLLHHNTMVMPTPGAADTFTLNLGTTEGANEWNAAATLGTDDTTGLKNIYFEDNTWSGFLEIAWDCDNGARVVARHNTFTDSSITAHGGGSGTSGNDTSLVGCRHMEIYDNTFVRVSNAVAINKWVWMRGSSGVIANNVIPRADSPDGSSFPNKPELRLTVGCPGAYPIRYQVGQTTDTADSTPNQPLAIFGNTGAGTGDSDYITVGDNPNNACGTPSTYIQSGRDYVTSNTWGWTAYPYPHPLQSGATVPTAPSNIRVTQP